MNGHERYRHRIATPNNYSDTLQAIASLVAQAEAKESVHATVGLGIPGSISQNGTVKNANSVWLNGQPLPDDLQRVLGRPVRIANDANCFAVSEAVDGAAKGAHCVFGVIIGTGCGGGIVIDGKPLSGVHGLAGEWGHNPLPFPVTNIDVSATHQFFDQQGKPKQPAIYQQKVLPEYTVKNECHIEYPGPLCYCGKRGCLETWLSGPGFQHDFRRNGGDALAAQDIIELARSGDPKAQAALERYCERLAKSLAQMINVLDPDAIVLGGGMSNIDELYQQVPQRWDRYIFTGSNDPCRTPLLKARHGDSSGVRGAAWL